MTDGKLTEAAKGASAELVRGSGTLLSNVQAAVSALKGLGLNPSAGTSGSSFGGGNQRSSSPYSGMGSAGANSYSGMGAVPDPKYRGTALNTMVNGLVGSAAGLAAAAAMAMPSGDEAMTTQLMGSRMKFYGGASSLHNAYGVQQRLAQYGMPNDALDAVRGSMQGVSNGLLPGLSNFSSGISSGFGGVLGGAALASNLVPGMGIQGGMSAMSGLNTARNVNMLRMMGISVRSSEGDVMKDLPDVIKRLYDILAQASPTGTVTARDIAISSMSGNALDSILNQYFSSTPELRMTIIAGLMQMSNTGGKSLATTGTQAFMRATGGTIRAASSISQLYAQELKLIQSYAKPTLQGVTTANDVLYSLYGALAGKSNNNIFSGTSALVSGLETFGAARNGAGALMMGAISDGAGALLSPFSGSMAANSPWLKLGGLAAGVATTAAIGSFIDNNTMGTHIDPPTTRRRVASNITVNVMNASGDVANIGHSANTAINLASLMDAGV